MTPTSIVAYLVLFAAVGFVFLFAALLLGRFLRANVPSDEKLEPYECGEPPVGSAFVQFDLRFYVVALVFIIFEVEVAFFFPWATVFGKATQLVDLNQQVEKLDQQINSPETDAASKKQLIEDKQRLLKKGNQKQEELGVNPAHCDFGAAESKADSLALASMADMGVFFGVLLVGFAYVWRRGDLNWVRAAGQPAGGGET